MEVVGLYKCGKSGPSDVKKSDGPYLFAFCHTISAL